MLPRILPPKPQPHFFLLFLSLWCLVTLRLRVLFLLESDVPSLLVLLPCWGRHGVILSLEPRVRLLSAVCASSVLACLRMRGAKDATCTIRFWVQELLLTWSLTKRILTPRLQGAGTTLDLKFNYKEYLPPDFKVPGLLLTWSLTTRNIYPRTSRCRDYSWLEV